MKIKSKRIMAAMLATVTIAAISIPLAGCGGSDNSSSSSIETSTSSSSVSSNDTVQTAIIGTWKFDHMTLDGKDMSIDDYISDKKIQSAVSNALAATGSSYSDNDIKRTLEALADAEENATYVFKNDGICTATISSTTLSGKYIINGSTVTINFDGNNTPTKFTYIDVNLSCAATNGIDASAVFTKTNDLPESESSSTSSTYSSSNYSSNYSSKSSSSTDMKICPSCGKSVWVLITKKDKANVTRTWCTSCWDDYYEIIGY